MLPRRIANLRRFYSTSPPTPTPTSRISRLEARLPTFLHRFTTPLRDAPVSHITSFLLLHELTAVVPLFGLAAFFHYTDYLPPYLSEGAWVEDSVGRFARFARRRGWVGEGEGEVRGVEGRWWEEGGDGVRIVAELATAYAVIKALLPVRIVGCVVMTPWFARGVVRPVGRLVGRVVGGRGTRVGRIGGAGRSGAAGTGAIGGGVGGAGSGVK
ncbi:hypothetical protein Tdes44962_MAKER06156 [Teratosphaeria destructans]|uniref:Uncharacterized protein n=1 Tax=Teratosphaeria destructans TaxID=418781 RepID=A0A9W7SIJ1_9PEZI|nr:hypothetical protein Tdes44962_MAKER06156 [Teratosphaeria destructans]